MSRFDTHRTPKLTFTPTAAGSITHPADSGDVAISIDPTTYVLRVHDSSTGDWALTARAKLDATADPTTSDDDSAGYSAGSLWVDVTNDKSWVCVDASTGAAVWKQTGGTGAGTTDHGALTGLADDDHTQYIKDSEFTAADTVLLGTGSGTFTELQHGFSKTTAPTGTDDNTAGWAVGSIWIDTTGDTIYICYDATTSNALWQEVGAGGGGSITVQDEAGTVSDSAVTIIRVPEGTLVDNGTGDVSIREVPTGFQVEQLGTTTIGGSFTTVAEVIYKQITLTKAGLITSISAAIKGNGSNVGQTGVAIFADNSSAPGVLLAVGASDPFTNTLSTYKSTTAAWVSRPLNYYAEAGTYWIAFLHGPYATPLATQLAYASGTGSDYRLAFGSGGDYFADSSLVAEASTTNDYSIYADVYYGAGNVAGLDTDSVRYTAGSLTLNSTTWTAVSGPGTLTVPAQVGDVLSVSASVLWGAEAVGANLDFATMVSSSPVNYISGGNPATPDQGIMSLYGTAATDAGSENVSAAASIQYTVVAGDIENGNVTLQLRYRTGSASNKTLLATSTYPLHFSVVNLRSQAQRGYAQGTAFPSGPATGTHFVRTDLDYETFFYDGTNWVTSTVYSVSHYLTTAADAIAQTGVGGSSAFSSLQPVALLGGVHVTTTNTGANYWTITLRSIADGTTTATVRMTIDTSAESPDVYNNLEDTSGTAFALPVGGLRFHAIKTGSPGTLTAGLTFQYRLIAT